jgi:hypothetical protein
VSPELGGVRTRGIPGSSTWPALRACWGRSRAVGPLAGEEPDARLAGVLAALTALGTVLASAAGLPVVRPCALHPASVPRHHLAPGRERGHCRHANARPAASTPPSAAAPTGIITGPRNGATNVSSNEQLRVSGTAHNIPAGYRLDVFLQFAGHRRYYAAANPGNPAPLINGHWSATISIGQAQAIILWLVLAVACRNEPHQQ